MPTAQLNKVLVGGLLIDVVMTGEAARICQKDRRTFLRWAEMKGIKPVASVAGRALYKREDVQRLAEIIKKSKQKE